MGEYSDVVLEFIFVFIHQLGYMGRMWASEFLHSLIISVPVLSGIVGVKVPYND